MTLLAVTFTQHNGVVLAEIGEILGLLGGLAIVLGGITPFAKRIGHTVGGLGVALGFLLLVIATHWGHFH